MPKKDQRACGDYQTPRHFSDRICAFLFHEKKLRPDIVLEPTCGTGNFLASSLLFNARKYYGIEKNLEYCEQCRNSLSDKRVKILHADILARDLQLPIQDNVLILGNPPWVTVATLTRLDAANSPARSNFRNLKGLSALTGESNFDLCEAILTLLLDKFDGREATLAMLCKTSVARKTFLDLVRRKRTLVSCELLEFDARKIFHVNASACLLLIQLTAENRHPEHCTVSDFDKYPHQKHVLLYKDGMLHASDADTAFTGHCCFVWRQGIKHDCAKIMELEHKGAFFLNGHGEEVHIEHDLIFPLVKGSMFRQAIIRNFSKYVLVTQKMLHEDTVHLQKDHPLTWAYLQKYKEAFARRKSSIYRGAPPFSMFGTGPYAYALYKVGISGFSKKPFFSLLLAEDQKPVMVDDTGYFLPFDSFSLAYAALLYLNSEQVQRFLTGCAFPDAKRPYTKRLLSTIDFSRVCAAVHLDELLATEQQLGLEHRLTAAMIDEFRACVRHMSLARPCAAGRLVP